MTTSQQIPCLLCGGPLDDAQPITVCVGCHGRLLVASSAMVSSTVEFAAVSDLAADAMLEGGSANAAAGPGRAFSACTWCGRTADQVKKLLRGNDACICNECVALCSDILQAELGEGWR
jgi:hypothetical protein